MNGAQLALAVGDRTVPVIGKMLRDRGNRLAEATLHDSDSQAARAQAAEHIMRHDDLAAHQAMSVLGKGIDHRGRSSSISADLSSASADVREAARARIQEEQGSVFSLNAQIQASAGLPRMAKRVALAEQNRAQVKERHAADVSTLDEMYKSSDLPRDTYQHAFFGS